MLHELGHFATAKWSGMKVTEYFVGFGPRLWSVRRGETEYGVKAIPAGGYVRITGFTVLEDVATEDEPRTYRQQPFWKRIIVGSAGSAMHFLIAFVLALISVLAFGVATNNVQISSLEHWTGVAQTPAQQAGLAGGRHHRLGQRPRRCTAPTPSTTSSPTRSASRSRSAWSATVTLRSIVVTPQDGRGVKVGNATLAPSERQDAAGLHRDLRRARPRLR